MEIGLVAHGSPAYWQAVELRRRVLRIPLGLDFTDAELAAESDDLHLVARDADGNVSGCLILVDAGSGVVKMRQVAVDPALQRLGLGTELVRASEQIARERGFLVMRLHARDSAVPFYARLGYEVEGPEFEEVGIPHRKMARPLR